MKRIIASMFVLALAAPIPVVAQAASDFPSKPVRVMVPFPPGGALDLLARKFGEKMQAAWGQPIVVENKPGAGTLIATELLSRAAPDGYTIMLTSPAGLTQAPALYSKLNYDPTGFSAITQVAVVPVALITRSDLPAATPAELVKYLKAHKGKANYASFGNGSTMHIYGEAFKRLSGTDATHVPYKGDAPSMAALLGGEVQYLFTNPVSAINFQKQGRVRILAVTGTRRVSALPDTPTMAEAGMKGFEPEGWYGYIGPGKMPQPVLQKLHATIAGIIQDPEMLGFLRQQGTIPTGAGPVEFGAAIQGERKVWSRLIKDIGVRLD